MIAPLFLVLVCLPQEGMEPVGQAQIRECDVIAYGATPAGIAATIQARRMGKTALLLEPTNHVGGLTSSGLGYTDTGDKSVIGGISREFYQRVKKHYDNPAAWRHEDRSKFGGYRANDDAMWVFEPGVAETLLRKMLADEKVECIEGAALDRQSPKGVVKEGKWIREIRDKKGRIYRARMFIDATYEGDLMAAAGVSFTVGREANATYGETLNGFQPFRNLHNHRFVKPVDPFKKPGDPSSGLVFGIEPGPFPNEGGADHRVQAYCFRMCMTKVPENRLDFPKPADYREENYELLFRNLEAGDLRFPMHPGMMPNGKTDTNNNGAVSTDFIGFSNDYPTATDERRLEIIREHESWQKGLMWTLKHHPRTPQAMRTMMRDWGLAKDEFPETGGWPHQIYVREARRMVGEHVMTEKECRGLVKVPGPVGMGSYNMDSHNCARLVKKDGTVQNEGDIQESPGGPYSISYLSLCPKKEECSNLLVPVCLSSSHMAYGSIRMEPVFFILGQSAATAACMAIEGKITVQEIAYDALKTRLVADGQVLEKARKPRPVGKANLVVEKMEGWVIDDSRARKEGPWKSSASIPGFVGEGYLHDGDELKGMMKIHFEQKDLPKGRYEIRIYYTAASNRSKKVPVDLVTGGETQRVWMNQTVTDPKGYWKWDSGLIEGNCTVTISNEATVGHVVVDAVQWIKKP